MGDEGYDPISPGGYWENTTTGAGGEVQPYNVYDYYTPDQLAEMNQRAYAPTVYGPSPHDSDSAWINSGQSLRSWNAGAGGGFMPQGYTGPTQGQVPGGQRAMAQQTPQQIALGKPEDDLYKRYKSLLMNPDFSQDPTYKFLYNQGLQSLNRNLAAQRMTLSGKSLNDTLAYGAGTASKYLQDLFPQYRAGAAEELNRFLGPAGLLPRYQAGNNAAITQSAGLTDRAGGYQMPLRLEDPSGYSASGGGGIGYGGLNYRLPNSSNPLGSPAPTQRPLQYNENYSPSGQFDPYYDGYDVAGGPAYG